MDEAQIALVLHTTVPMMWAVEVVNSDGEGAIEMTQFYGPDAEQRAREYTIWKYGLRAPEVVAA